MLGNRVMVFGESMTLFEIELRMLMFKDNAIVIKLRGYNMSQVEAEGEIVTSYSCFTQAQKI